jgi:ABC-type branched-subunit amino acid transport system ATPase component
VLSTRNLNKSFGSLVVAQDIALELPEGVRYALIGPNGAGKTTLINLLTGMVRPDAGEIRLGEGENEADITALTPDARVRRGLARTFQINTLFPQLTALESVTIAVLERERHAHNWWRTLARFDAAIEEAAAILASLRLGDVAHRPTRELAYGQQRLLEIALALATRPSVLLLDEPAAGLSDAESQHLGEVIVRLAHEGGLAVLMIEHDVALVSAICDRVVVLDFGRKIAEGPPHDVTRDELVIAAYLGQPGTVLDTLAPEMRGDRGAVPEGVHAKAHVVEAQRRVDPRESTT